MASGHPDGGEGGQSEIITSVTDIGELAARLGAINTYYRSGNVIWFEDFEGGFNKWKSSATGSTTITIDTDFAHKGGTSLKLATNDTTAGTMIISKDFIKFDSNRLGVEFMFFAYGRMPNTFALRFEVYDGVNLTRYWLVFDTTTDKIQVRDDQGDTVDVADYSFAETDGYLFNHVKLFIDITNNSYDKVFVNENEIDLSSYEAQVTSNAGQVRHHLELRLASNTIKDDIVYLDNIVLTINEP